MPRRLEPQMRVWRRARARHELGARGREARGARARGPR
jgi:hypothetical protein